MARIFVMNDNLTTRVEMTYDDEDNLMVICVGCNRGESTVHDLMVGERSGNYEDAIEEVASPHAYSCMNCADDACMIPTRHVRGHRCRKI
jgi:hypothetical protein